MRRRSRAAFITRADVQDLLGVDRSKLKRMEKAGEVPFLRDERGIHRFPRELIEKLAAERGRPVGVPPGSVAAKAFAMFAHGRTWQEVVIALQQPPELVRALLDQYREGKRVPMGERRAAPRRDDDAARGGFGDRF